MRFWRSPVIGHEQNSAKTFDSYLIHKSLKDNLADCLKAGKVPEWMTKGKIMLIQKDPAKGNDPSNYRPITCLLLARKILTGIIAEETCTFLEQRSLLPEEQKECRKGSRGTGDLLYIDRMLLQEVKRFQFQFNFNF